MIVIIKKVLAIAFLFFIVADLKAQDQTINGDLYVGAGSHDQWGFSKRISFIGNSDVSWIPTI